MRWVKEGKVAKQRVPCSNEMNRNVRTVYATAQNGFTKRVKGSPYAASREKERGRSVVAACAPRRSAQVLWLCAISGRHLSAQEPSWPPGDGFRPCFSCGPRFCKAGAEIGQIAKREIHLNGFGCRSPQRPRWAHAMIGR